jgi:hypothetical protein
MATFVKGQPAKIARTVSWYRELSRYQWFVFIVASLGWMFDTMDQQLFNLARRPAIVLGLLTSRIYADKPEPMRYAGVTMSLIFLVGLATLPFAPETKGKPLPE